MTMGAISSDVVAWDFLGCFASVADIVKDGDAPVVVQPGGDCRAICAANNSYYSAEVTTTTTPPPQQQQECYGSTLADGLTTNEPVVADSGAPCAIATQSKLYRRQSSSTLPDGWNAFPGCIGDNPNRLLTGFMNGDGTVTFDASQCIAHCSAHGFAVAGTQFGDQCFCADSFAYAPSQAVFNATVTACSPCLKNALQMCGGAWSLNVFSKQYASVADVPVGNVTSTTVTTPTTTPATKSANSSSSSSISRRSTSVTISTHIPSTSAAPPQPSDQSSDGISTIFKKPPVIAGIAGGGTFILAVIIFAVWLTKKRRRDAALRELKIDEILLSMNSPPPIPFTVRT